jgi:hypothetical protein
LHAQLTIALTQGILFLLGLQNAICQDHPLTNGLIGLEELGSPKMQIILGAHHSKPGLDGWLA